MLNGMGESRLPRILRQCTKLALVPLLLVGGLRHFVMRGYLVQGESMEPTLHAGDFLIVNRAAVGASTPVVGWWVPGYAEPRRFDILVVRVGAGRGSRPLVAKRVIGLPGEHISMIKGFVFIGNQPLFEQYATPSLKHNTATRAMEWQLSHVAPQVDRARYFPTNGNWGPLLVPAGSYFVLGDKRDLSVDSRELGFVPHANVIGRVDRVLSRHAGTCCSPGAIVRGLRR